MARRKLTDAQVIRARFNREGWTATRWAKEYGVHQSTMHRALEGFTFCHIRIKYNKVVRPDRKLTEDQAAEIRENREGLPFRRLGAKYGISARTAADVFYGVRYKDVA